MATIYLFLYLLLGTIHLAAARSEVIPGPGLPSLASLGLNSEQLYSMPFDPSTDSGLDKLASGFDSICQDQTKYGAPAEDVLSCYHYLNQLNTTNCQVSGPNGYKQVFCTAGSAMVVGQNIGTAPGGTGSRW
jgi:hypothetical protein